MFGNWVTELVVLFTPTRDALIRHCLTIGRYQLIQKTYFVVLFKLCI